MTTIKTSLIIVLSLFITGRSLAQAADPTIWDYETKKINDTEYQLIFHLDQGENWRVFSRGNKADSVLMPMATSFNFNKNDKAKLKGGVIEKGRKLTHNFEYMTGTYFENKVDYVQHVTVSGTTMITGKLYYQVMNDNTSTSRRSKDFSFVVN